MRGALLYVDGCPNWHVADSLLETLPGGIGFDLDRRMIKTVDEAERLQRE